MIDLGKKNILGVLINAVDYESATEQIVSAAKSCKPFSVSALAVHGVMTGVLDAQHRHRLNRLDLVTPDGQPVRWALNYLHGCGLPDRVYGPKMMLEVCRRAAEEKLPVFLFGGKQELLDRLHDRLTESYPNLQIAGMAASRFHCLDEPAADELAAKIQQSGAALTFVGLGCPRQEVWAYEFRQRLKMPVIAVGAAFNMHAGELQQAPPWMQRLGLEWLFRLWMEPTRLWRRYVLLNPLYLSMLALQYTGLRKYDENATIEPDVEILYG